MKKSDALRVLPSLEAERGALELCTYCPKLCRAACPIGDASPREGLIPWGKMTTAYQVARGVSPLDHAHAASAWACTGCMGCRERCDPRNDVAATLVAARAAFAKAGVAPAAIEAHRRGHARRVARAERGLARIGAAAGASVDPSGAPLFLGCTYARGLPREAVAMVRAVARLLGGPVRLVGGCCGEPLRDAGDPSAADAARSAVAAAARGEVLWVADPGCAFALSFSGADARSIVALAASRLGALGVVERAGPVRYHDSCKLGRGLGLYDEPRAVLTAILGRAPEELEDRRELARCSGAGGALPTSHPELSRGIASARRADHEGAGGGALVTACPASALSLRRAGVPAEELGVLLDLATS
ncbi:MAG: (Fe-S)-binding protein [Polyangiaceae bacterium]|nr:(Fe-S)-binding protein [Polyangiaceae bacterium]